MDAEEGEEAFLELAKERREERAREVVSWRCGGICWC